VAIVALNGTKLRGTVTLATARYDLDCVVEREAVSGKYLGEVAGAATNGTVTGTFGPLPYGHGAFSPTPERPLGFRGDGNGWFPGATPVVEFYEGTPTKAERTIVDRGQEKKAQVWAKEMEDGSKAVGFFNLGSEPADIAVDWPTVGVDGRCVVRDLWRQKDVGEFEGSFTAKQVLSHGVLLVRIIPASAGSATRPQPRGGSK
jgi:hypothetical protein